MKQMYTIIIETCASIHDINRNLRRNSKFIFASDHSMNHYLRGILLRVSGIEDNARAFKISVPSQKRSTNFINASDCTINRMNEKIFSSRID